MKLGEAIQGLEQTTASAFTAMKAAVQELLETARISDLTGLHNAMALEEDFDQIQREEAPYYILFGDLDGFKYINDTHTHEAGDVALSRAGSALRMVADSWNARAYHKSGDEFVILVPGDGKDGLIADLTQQFSRVSMLFEDATLAFSGSFGCVGIGDLDRLGALQRAEAACKIAKRRGRECVVHEWSSDDELNEIDRRFRCDCGTAWSCVLAGEHRQHTILHCPVCQKQTAITRAEE